MWKLMEEEDVDNNGKSWRWRRKIMEEDREDNTVEEELEVEIEDKRGGVRGGK